MNICVAGWYFYAPLINVLRDRLYYIIAHREPDKAIGNCTVIPNVGLEFGCYDYYLKQMWAGGDALFIHDDTCFTPRTLDVVAALTCDQAFLFGSEADAKANGGAHGRVVFCSERFLTQLKRDGGFWFNEGAPTPNTIPATSADAPDYHNAAIQVFQKYCHKQAVAMKTNQIVIVPELITGYRGRL